MKITYKNKKLEKVVFAVNVIAALMVAASFVLLFGFHKPLLPAHALYIVQGVLLCIFIAEKIIRFFNAFSKMDYLRCFWYHIPLLIALAAVVFGAGRWFAMQNPTGLRHLAIGVYLVIGVLIKLCRTTVNMAATGRNPTQTLIASFLVLILSGAGILTLPKASRGQSLSVVDAIFTATSATCVTGLIVKDTGSDFTLTGQIVILSLIQLGGLGIVMFGAIFALLLGQALTLRESVAMQDLLNARTVNRIGNMIVFIVMGTIFIEAVGAFTMFAMWDDVAGWQGGFHQKWFYSIFHAISAFCNAGFSLFPDSLIGYQKNWGVYAIICPLIVLGGLGFGVLYNISGVITDRVKNCLKRWFSKTPQIAKSVPKTLRLQTKLVLTVSGMLIVLGTLAILFFEHTIGSFGNGTGFGEALFQSITARTAGFNTIDIASMSNSAKFVIMVLMFIGGSPGSTAGGIKTVTLAVIIMTVFAALRKRSEVEVFNRSVRIVVVGRAITVVMLFIAVLFCSSLLLTVTESESSFTDGDIWFESASALGTVGLTSGITPFLTTAGKWIIICNMLIGRLGPLTLLALLTFNLKPVKYNYPDEAIIVG